MFAVALAVLIHCLIVARSPVVAVDGFTFVELAKKLAHDPLTTIRDNDQHAGFPALIVVVRPLIEKFVETDASWIAAARFVGVISSVISVLLIWQLTRRMLGVAAANYAGILFACLPAIRQNAADALSDAPHLMLFLAATWLTCEGLLRKRWPWFLLAGAVSGGAFWIRPEGLSVAIVAAFLSLFLICCRQQFGFRQGAACCLSVVLGAVVVVTPYLMITGEVTKKVTSKIGWSSVQPPVAVNQPVVETAPIIKSSPATATAPMPAAPADSPAEESSLLKTLGKALTLFCFRFTEGLHLLIVPYFFGLPWALRKLKVPTQSLLWTLGLAHISLLIALYFLGGYMERRHLLPLIALVLPIAAMGIMQLLKWMQSFCGAHRRLGWLPGFAVIVIVAVLTSRSVRPLHPSHLHKLRAVEWVEAHAERGDRVFSNSQHVVHYCGDQSIAEPLNATSDVWVSAAQGEHRFIVIERGTDRFDPAWDARLSEQYSKAVTIPGDPALRQRDVVIYQANQPIARVSRRSSHTTAK